MAASSVVKHVGDWWHGGVRNTVLGGCDYVWSAKVRIVITGGLLALRYIAESLDELSDMVATLFSPIPNRGKEPLHLISEHPFGPNEMGVSGMTPVQSRWTHLPSRPLFRYRQ